MTTATPTITNTEYRRTVMQRLAPVKETKKGLRALMRKQSTVQLSHALAGIVSEIAEVMEVLRPWLLGNQQLNDDIRQGFKDESGDLYYYAHLAAGILKVKRPAPTKKVKVTRKATELAFELNRIAVNIAGTHKKVYYGQNLNTDKLKVCVTELLDVLQHLTWALLNQAPVHTLVYNRDKLAARHGEAFNLAAIQAKEAAKERAEARIH